MGIDCCEVCGRVTTLGDARSTISETRHFYCFDCLRTGAEPYPLLVGRLAATGDDNRDDLARSVQATLRATGKRRAQLLSDVERARVHA